MTESTSIKDQTVADDNIEKIHGLYEAFEKRRYPGRPRSVD